MTNIIRAFATMRTGLALLAVIILLAVAGTFIPQERDIAAGPAMRFFYHTLGFGNLYHSWWFGSLLLLLCLNIACCSFSRLPALWRETLAPPPWPAVLDGQQCRLPLPPDGAARQVKERLALAGYRVWDAGGGRLCARKGRLASWGAFLVHASVLLIAAGGLYGSLAGFRYFLQLVPGEAVTIGAGAYPAAGRPFELRLNAFTTERYPDGQVADWISSLTVARDGAEVLRQDVKVNHPLTYQGISFYQISYENLYEIERQDSGRRVRVAENQPVVLDERRGMAVVPLKYLPDFDPRRPLVSRSPRSLNPHVVYLAFSGGRPLGINAAPLGKPVTLPGAPDALVFSAVREASGLDVKHDPGLPLVFAGFAVMGAAFFLSLVPRRRVVWVEITPAGEAAVIVVAVSGRPPAPPEEAARLCRRLTHGENG